MQPLLTIAEAGRELKVGRSTIYCLIRKKELSRKKIGRCVRVTAESVERVKGRGARTAG
jgi:excisionase family DNA binding protein